MPTPRPTGRWDAAMAFDAASGHVLLFGGADATGVTDETWRWDGATWLELTPATVPPARYGAMMAYDPVRERIVMFAGRNYADAHGDTWEWDGTNWHDRTTPDSPTPRSTAGTVYDHQRRRVVLLGGVDDVSLGDTWEWDGAEVERCILENEDADGDGLGGCADPDCWGRCSPRCSPGASCAATTPRYGDGTCAAIEDALLCPDDCP